MNRQSVTSKNIASVGYDEQTQRMEVEFKSGGIYLYENVPKREYEEFIGASSLGGHFHHNIRSKYSGSRQ